MLTMVLLKLWDSHNFRRLYFMNRIAKELVRIARELIADSDYIYDPDHKKKPAGGYHKTEKGWSKKEQKKDKPVKTENKPVNKGLSESHKQRIDGLSNKDKQKLAESKEATPEILDYLSDSDDLDVLLGVSKNENASKKTIQKLSGFNFKKVWEDQDYDYQKVLKNCDLLEKVMTHKNKTDQSLNKIIDNVNFDFEDDVYIDTMSEAFLNIMRDKNNNKATREKAFCKLSEHNFEEYDDASVDDEIDLEFANDENTSEQTFSCLSVSKNKEVQEAVALTCSYSFPLYNLPYYSDRRVQVALANNTSTPSDILEEITQKIQYNDYAVLQGVITNPNTPTETLKTIKYYRDSWDGKGNYLSKMVSEELSERKGKQKSKKQQSKGNQNKGIDFSKMTPELRQKIKDWDIEDIKKFINWLHKNGYGKGMMPTEEQI